MFFLELALAPWYLILQSETTLISYNYYYTETNPDDEVWSIGPSYQVEEEGLDALTGTYTSDEPTYDTKLQGNAYSTTVVYQNGSQDRNQNGTYANPENVECPPMSTLTCCTKQDSYYFGQFVNSDPNAVIDPPTSEEDPWGDIIEQLTGGSWRWRLLRDDTFSYIQDVDPYNPPGPGGGGVGG